MDSSPFDEEEDMFGGPDLESVQHLANHQTMASQLATEEAGQKRMKELVPYTSEEKYLLLQTVEVDFSDTIPNTHDEDAVFVQHKDMEWNGLPGKYTGSWKDGNANGRGTWRIDGSGDDRIDAIWKDGKMQGKGRKMDVFNHLLLEGIWDKNAAAGDYCVRKYHERTGSKSSTLKKGTWS